MENWKKIAQLMVLLVVPLWATAGRAQVTLTVYEADAQTAFDPNGELMVGDRLALVISSDTNDFWQGGLFIRGQDRALGTLAARDFDANTRDWTGSHLEDAGDFAKVYAWKDSAIWGFDIYSFYPDDGNSEDTTTVAGDWFIIDYYADDVGDCNVEFCNYDPNAQNPVSYITFHHVPTRDLNADEAVDFGDFAVFAPQWNVTGCNDPNWCDGADLDRDGNVELDDLELFVDYWLWPSYGESPPDGNNPDPPEEDPNIIYSIVDANDNNEITIDVNESITLYVKMATAEPNSVATFEIEVNISDTNLGSIDNTAYDPNDPPGPGTARILAQPRDSSLDYWGPGTEQEEGIELHGACFTGAISDGNLASFVFTSTGEGDVTLQLINWSSTDTDCNAVFPTLESITIHQVIGGMQQSMSAPMEETSSTATDEPNIDEIVDWMDDVWREDQEIKKNASKPEWNEFIDSVESTYPWSN
ncbi:MAG: hypothetical protein ACYTEQ_04005 [Planctomycetota bacterium]